MEKAIEKYAEWSAPQVHEKLRIPIFYCSAYGNTCLLAQQIAAGIAQALPTAQIETYDIVDYDMAYLADLLNSSDAFLIGSPTINRDAVPPVNILLCHTDAINIAKRPCAIFGSYGWSGEAFNALRSRLTSLKTKLYPEDFKVIFVPSEADLTAAKEFGKSFAKWFKE